MDTIFAIATGAVRAGVAIIRISGPQAGSILETMSEGPLPPPRLATRRPIRGDSGEIIDNGLVLWFPAPGSFTGENVAELHVHGGSAVVVAVLEGLAAADGTRPAEAGEFTRRAFENGKLDLTAAEGLADLVNSETEAQRRQAFRQMQGDLAKIYETWRGRLLQAVGHLEATIDFSDEDLPEEVDSGVLREVGSLRNEIRRHLAEGSRGERIRTGIRVAIIGPPNAGKSSILNVLARRDAAIVSHHPGTTRDVIEVPLDLGGFPVIVADTAGIREAEGEIEEEGVRRARMLAQEADVKIAVFDGGVWPEVDVQTRGLLDAETFAVVNKADLGRVGADVSIGDIEGFAVSALTGVGIDRLVARMEKAVVDRFSQTTTPAFTRARHRRALEECHQALCRFTPGLADELGAEELRLAARALGRITGRVDVEQVLDVIFRDFCIGK